MKIEKRPNTSNTCGNPSLKNRRYSSTAVRFPIGTTKNPHPQTLSEKNTTRARAHRRARSQDAMNLRARPPPFLGDAARPPRLAALCSASLGGSCCSAGCLSAGATNTNHAPLRHTERISQVAWRSLGGLLGVSPLRYRAKPMRNHSLRRRFAAPLCSWATAHTR